MLARLKTVILIKEALKLVFFRLVEYLEQCNLSNSQTGVVFFLAKQIFNPRLQCQFLKIIKKMLQGEGSGVLPGDRGRSQCFAYAHSACVATLLKTLTIVGQQILSWSFHSVWFRVHFILSHLNTVEYLLIRMLSTYSIEYMERTESSSRI